MSNGGSVFSITTAGKVKGLHRWQYVETNGTAIDAGITNVNDILYGVAQMGGAYWSNTNRGGTVFSLTTSGTKFRVIHSFGKDSDGFHPDTDLTSVGGVVYGMTSEGGTYGQGLIFAVEGRNYRVIYNLPPSAGSPARGKLVEHGAILYGAAAKVIFSIHTDGSSYRALHVFGSPPDGAGPTGDLLYLNGSFYGTTNGGGTHRNGTVFRINAHGNSYAVLHNFRSRAYDGSGPGAGLINIGNTLYGTTYEGGLHGGGVIFSITPSGQYNILYNLSAVSYPTAPLVDVKGTLYGTGQGVGNAKVFALCP